MENMRGQKGDKIQKSVFYALQVYTIFFKTPKEKCLIILKHTDESILTTFNTKFTSGRTQIQQASAKLRNVFVKALLWC